MDLHPDFKDLLAEFDRSKVEYIVIGGHAVAVHGRPRATKDLDLLVSRRDGNLIRVSEALERFGAPANVVRAARALAETEVLFFGEPPVRVDVLASVDGIDTDEAIRRAIHVELSGRAIPVVGLEDLIANKRASGRPQDLADVHALTAIAGRR